MHPLRLGAGWPLGAALARLVSVLTGADAGEPAKSAREMRRVAVAHRVCDFGRCRIGFGQHAFRELEPRAVDEARVRDAELGKSSLERPRTRIQKFGRETDVWVAVEEMRLQALAKPLREVTRRLFGGESKRR